MVKEFTYRGLTKKELESLSLENMLRLFPARIRRSLTRGITDNKRKLINEIKMAKTGKNITIKYGAQVHHSPPIFAFFSNHPKAIPVQYKRYLENSLRENFGFEGVPIKISLRENK